LRVDVVKRHTIGKFEEARTFFSKLRGLMFRRGIAQPLVFTFAAESRANAIHSLFVFFPFDAVFLDASRRVADVQGVQPFSLLVTPKAPAKYLIEMRAGAAKKMGLRIGDEVRW
jgi:uncharacterized membrane protein (UPF0127 family)